MPLISGDLRTLLCETLKVSCADVTCSTFAGLLEVPGVDLSYQDEDCGATPAHWACWGGQTQCVLELANTGRVDWNRRNTNRGATPLNDALWQAHSDIVSIIVSQPDIDYSVTTHDGETLTQLAVRRAGEKCVEILAAQEKCKSWNIPDKNGDTPILAAIKSNKIEIVRLLMKCPRVDLKIKDKNGSSLEDLARWFVNNLIFDLDSFFLARTEIRICWRSFLKLQSRHYNLIVNSYIEI